jgi:hypothetical protein
MHPGGEGNDKRVPDPERGTDLRDDQGSGGRNPKGATGTKQGRDGPDRSARRETANNRTRRLAGTWIPQRDLPILSCMRRRGRNPTRGAGRVYAIRRLLPVTLRREGEDHERMGQEVYFIGPGSPRNCLEVQSPEGARAWREQQSDTLLPRRSSTL